MTASYPLCLLAAEPTWHGRALSGRPLDLLAALAGADGARMSQGALVEALWPDDAPARPLRALHVVVSRVRAVVGQGVVERSGDGYRLALAAGDVDARDLADRAGRARTCAAAGQWDRVLELTRDLPGPVGDADPPPSPGRFAVGAVPGRQVQHGSPGPTGLLRGRAGGHAAAAARDRALALEATGDYEQAANLLWVAVEADPGDETALAALMRAEAWVRSPAAALEIYEDYRLRLREQGAVPGPAVRAAHEAALAAENPVRRGLEPGPEHFLGREDDVAYLLKALSTRRLVTVTGPGGVGKTTLAQAVAARSPRPAVYVARLADVPAGADLARVLLDALGGPLPPEADPRARLGAVLAAPGTLLVLDNCEHLVGAVADLVGALLAGCPDLRVLATSRRPLDLGAECVHRLEPLDAASSAELFRARALAARPRQVIDEPDLDLLLERLEGIPLAIELAAARTRTLSVGQILTRLPGLLTGARDAPARQRTLSAVIQWSWDLLDPAERSGLERLAVLADGFTLAAAEALIGDGAAQVLDALVAHCLLNVRDRGVPRFHMLATVRDFATARLAGCGQQAQALQILRAWAVGLCSEVRLPLGAPGFGDVDSPQALGQDRLFQQLVDDEAVVVQVLDQVLQQVAEGRCGPGGRDGDLQGLEDTACVLGAALMRLWSLSWGYDRMVHYAPRLLTLAVRPARSLRGNEARLSLMALYASLSGALGPLPERVAQDLPRSFDSESPSMARVRRFLRTPSRMWPDLVHDADPWVAWSAGRCLVSRMENEGAVQAALDVVENLLDRLGEADLAGIYLFELRSARLHLLMGLGRHEQAGHECSRALQALDRLLPSWGTFYREALQLERSYCRAYTRPGEEAATRLLAAIDYDRLPGTLRFVVRSVSGELELARGSARQAALTQRASLRYVARDRWRSTMGAGSPWELYILSMCLMTDIELDHDEAVELDAGAVRDRAVPLLRDMLAAPAPRQRDVPTIMALAAAVGISTMALGADADQGQDQCAARAADGGPPQGLKAAGAELVARALAVGTNQTCRLLSHSYLRTRARALDAQAMSQAEEGVRHLDRAQLLAGAADLARALADEAG